MHNYKRLFFSITIILMYMSMNKMIIIAVVVIFVIAIVIIAKNKNEGLSGVLYSQCPPGFTVSLNNLACVLPGEHEFPCSNGQLYVDDSCRYPVEYKNVPVGWILNHTKTGIWNDKKENVYFDK